MVAAGNVNRRTLTVQHVGTLAADVRVWISRDAGMKVGDGMLLNGVGTGISMGREDGAHLGWYALAESGVVPVVVNLGMYD